MIKKSLLTLTLMVLFILTGCGASKLDIEQYSQTNKDKEISNHYLSQKIIDKKQTNVVILSPINNTSFQMNELSEKLNSHISSTLIRDGNINIINDPKVTDALKNNLKLDSYQAIVKNLNGSSLAEYAVINSIDSAKAWVHYTRQGGNYTDSDGYIVVVPQCKKQARITISYKFLNLHTGLIEKSVTSEGHGLVNIDGGREYECQLGNPVPILSDAIATAASRAKIKKYMASSFPTLGYIWKVSSHQDKRAAYITLGANDGIEPGDELIIVEYSKTINPVNGEEFIASNEIGKCDVVKNNFTSGKSICLITEGSDKVKVKHAVQSQSSTSWIDNF